MDSGLYIVNGKKAEQIDIFDRGLQFGDGVFETMLCIHGSIKNYEYHWDRLTNGCEKLAINCPDIKDVIRGYIADFNLQRGVAKLIVTRGSTKRGYWAADTVKANWILNISERSSPNLEVVHEGIVSAISPIRLCKDKLLGGIKHLNRLPQVLARQQMSADVQEVIMLDNENRVIEGCMSNIFYVREKKLLTPVIDDCGVFGVMRRYVMESARGMGIYCEERETYLNDILEADELFFTNSLIQIWPVRKLGDRVFSVGPTTRSLMSIVS